MADLADEAEEPVPIPASRMPIWNRRREVVNDRADGSGFHAAIRPLLTQWWRPTQEDSVLWPQLLLAAGRLRARLYRLTERIDAHADHVF